MAYRDDDTALQDKQVVGARRVRMRRVVAGVAAGGMLVVTASLSFWLQGQAPHQTATAGRGAMRIVSAAARVRDHFGLRVKVGIPYPNDPYSDLL